MMEVYKSALLTKLTKINILLLMTLILITVFSL